MLRERPVRAPLELPRKAVPSKAIQTKTPQPAPRIRVCLTSEPVEQVELEIADSYELREPGQKKVLGRGSALKPCQVKCSAKGLRIGNQAVAAAQIEIMPKSSPAIWVDGHQYRGTVRIYRRPHERLQVVNVLPLEAYVASVVNSEMPTEFGPEARKAQAICARGFALVQMRNAPAAAVFDVYGSVRSQRYLGYQYRDRDGRRLAGEDKGSRALAAATRGQICTDRGEPFCTYYSAVCGGRTMRGTEFFQDAGQALKSVPCEFCSAAGRYRWRVKVSRTKAAEALRRHCAEQGTQFGTLRTVRALPAGQGRIGSFQVSDGKAVVRISAQELRTLFGNAEIPSPRFDLSLGKDSLQFSGRGNGHGVGLCQWGARGQDHAGRKAEEILTHYYPGARITRLDYSDAPDLP